MFPKEYLHKPTQDDVLILKMEFNVDLVDKITRYNNENKINPPSSLFADKKQELHSLLKEMSIK